MCAAGGLNMSKKSSTSKLKLAISIVTILVIIVVGLVWAHRSLWWFTPAYSQRQTVQAFFGDLANGQSKKAYDLTSANFQEDNSFSSFQTQYNEFSTTSIKVNFKYYIILKGHTTIGGSTSNSVNNLKSNFGLILVKADGKYKVDATIIKVY